MAYDQLPPLSVPRDANDFITFRHVLDEMLDRWYERPASEHVLIEDREGPCTGGMREVPVRIYTPVARTGLLPALLWIHGGGFTVGSPKEDDFLLARIVEEVGCLVVAAEYRLAPEHPFPAAIDDCYATLLWMALHAQELGVDRDRLAIAGLSSGGGLCAGLGLMARDRGEVKVCFQMPLYACLDDRHLTASSYEITDARSWNRELSLKSWEVYLGTTSRDDVSPYAAPSRASNLAGLPPTYMMIGTHDLLRDENIDYATRLMQAGVPTEFHVYPGAFHAFEIAAPNARISQRATAEYIGALKRALKPL
ncbi:MAG: alpha/beta hydrolase [Chloroflexi bacterium]|nr:alpha/beta hydrolase [Chloroflexota bacterium]